MTDTKATEYLNTFPKSERVNLATVYPGAGEEAIDILHKILVFNPYFRKSIEESLDHEFFKKTRKPEKEVIAKEPIIIDWESSTHLDIKKLRSYFVEEINYFKELRKNGL